MKGSAPPPVLDGARLLAYKVIDEAVSHSGTSTLYVDGKPIGVVPCLAIAQELSGEVLLFFCDDSWTPIGAVGCASLPDAQKRAEKEYKGLSDKWVIADVSPQKAEQYIKEQDDEHRCSFCGRPPQAVNKIVSANGANICDRCVQKFYQALDSDK